MGCWNGTDQIINTPILEGDDVYFVFTSASETDSHPNGFCYPTDPAIPISLPMLAKYNGHGGVNDITIDDYTESFLEYIKEQINKDNIRISPDHNENIPNSDSLTLIEFAKLVERGRCLYDEFVGFRTVNLSLINKSTIDDFIPQVDITDELDYSGGILSKRWLNETINILNSSNREKIFMLDDTPYGRALNNMTEIKIHLNRVFRTNKYTEVPFIDKLWLLMFMNNLLSSLRKTWALPSGSVSQSDNWDYYRMMCNAITKQADAYDEEMYL